MRPVCACEERLIATPASIVATGITFETRRENTFKFIKDCSLRREMGPFPCKHIGLAALGTSRKGFAKIFLEVDRLYLAGRFAISTRRVENSHTYLESMTANQCTRPGVPTRCNVSVRRAACLISFFRSVPVPYELRCGLRAWTCQENFISV